MYNIASRLLRPHAIVPRQLRFAGRIIAISTADATAANVMSRSTTIAAFSSIIIIWDIDDATDDFLTVDGAYTAVVHDVVNGRIDDFVAPVSQVFTYDLLLFGWIRSAGVPACSMLLLLLCSCFVFGPSPTFADPCHRAFEFFWPILFRI
jgi:hypothetical protein